MSELPSEKPKPVQGDEPTRRDFLDLAIGGTSVCLVGLVGYPTVKYLVPPDAGEPTVTEVEVGPVEEMEPNSGKNVRFGAIPALVLVTPAGEVRAFNALCSHLNCIVEYSPGDANIMCACHNGRFGLDGSVLSGPPPHPLEALKVEIREGKIVIRRA